ncbi:MAG: replication-associated recombination protein A [Porticoccaceae bacterium]|jgi:putative ATPase
MSDDLFAQPAYQPLAARMRPRNLDEFAGQEHVLGEGKPLREAILKGHLHSMIFWGPPGVGKTTLAQMIARYGDAHFETLSAVLAGVKDIREAIARAQKFRSGEGRKTVLFVDEIHRFNKSQQDAFLPYVENGTVILMGATTENPSFELNNALLSRCRVYVFRSLDNEAILHLVNRALTDRVHGLPMPLLFAPGSLETLVEAADGDARRALNLLEIASDLAEDGRVDQGVLEEILVADARRFDKGGEDFYNQISALHKAVRGSSPDAALYWFGRMLDGGCDPLYIARRVVRMASEDIGNADPRGMSIALNAWDVQERLGSPEGELALAQAVIYLAVAPKSNAVYTAFNRVMSDIRKQPSYEVPLHIRNAPTALMKDLDYGKSYRYAHDEPDAFAAGENYFPEELADSQYYFPGDQGLEKTIAEKLARFRQLNAASEQRRYHNRGNK